MVDCFIAQQVDPSSTRVQYPPSLCGVSLNACVGKQGKRLKYCIQYSTVLITAVLVWFCHASVPIIHKKRWRLTCRLGLAAARNRSSMLLMRVHVGKLP
jgi:hypothetical protein